MSNDNDNEDEINVDHYNKSYNTNNNGAVSTKMTIIQVVSEEKGASLGVSA